MRAIATWAGTIFISYCLYLLTRAVYFVYFHPLSRFAGPKTWAFSPLPYVRAQLSGRIHLILRDLHLKYGDVVRIGPNQLSYVRDIFWNDACAYRQGHDEFMKSRLSMSTPVNDVPGILIAPRDAHKRYRRLLSPAFSTAGLCEQGPKIENYVNMLVERLREHSTKGPIDVVFWLNCLTFDLIGDLAFGEPFDCLKNGILHPWIEAIFGNVKAATFMAHLAFYGFGWLMPLMVPKRLFELRLINFHYTSEKIERRVKVDRERGDFLDKIINQEDETKGMTLEELKSNAANLVLAGSETTGTVLAGTIYLLLTYPQILAKLQREIFDAFDSEDQILTSNLEGLKYLTLVLQEAMRIYPPVPNQAIRVVPAGGDTIGGEFLPAKTMVHFSQYAVHHLESNFAEPESFDPDRWTDDASKGSKYANDNRSVFRPFSYGIRNCIGQNLAWAELRLIMVKLLWNFDWKLAKQTTENGNWLKNQKTYVLWEKEPLWVELRPKIETINGKQGFD